MAGIGSIRRDDEVPKPVFIEDELVESEVLVCRIRRSLKWKCVWPCVYIPRVNCWGRTSWLAWGDSWRIRRKGHWITRSPRAEPTDIIMVDDDKPELKILPFDEVL